MSVRRERVPRVLIAGSSSGCGKTTVTCAVLQALVDRGLRTGAFKCGPDYIDPMFHSRIIGAESSNLDLFFFGENTAKYLLARSGAGRDISVIEGVMGYYDGMGLTSSEASSWQVAHVTDTPAVLVVSARGASLSVLAAIHGFLTFYPDSGIRGVILNQCSPMTYAALAKEIQARFGDRVRPLGYLPKMPDCALESRHLGLVTAAEVRDLKEKMARLSAQAEQSIDLDALLELASGAAELTCEPVELPRYETAVRIAVARDNAFCFYYEDSLQVLRDMGAELVEFSPLDDAALPENIHGLYLGGGYPELYAGRLSGNTAMRASVRAALERGLPCIAECGGFMYLTEKIAEYPMVGFLPGTCHDTGKLTRFGYVTLTAKKDSMLFRAGESVRAHEFHHWDCTAPGADLAARKSTGKGWDCVTASGRLYAGYPHFHFYAEPRLAKNFYETCLKEREAHV